MTRDTRDLLKRLALGAFFVALGFAILSAAGDERIGFQDNERAYGAQREEGANK